MDVPGCYEDVDGQDVKIPLRCMLKAFVQSYDTEICF